MSEYQVGQVVEVKEIGLGTVRYVGQTAFAPGEWIGVECEDYKGKNDGSVKGDRYFECEMEKGLFLRAAGIERIVQQPAPAAKAVPAKKAARPSSSVSSGVGRRGSMAPDTGVGKRMSMNAASPSPVPRRPSSMIRVGSSSMTCETRI
jgi:dynactin 1